MFLLAFIVCYVCYFFFFFFNDTATTEIYTLSLHDALPIPGSPSGLGWLPDDTLLVVSMQETVLLRVENGSTMVHADLSAHSGPQSNDMVIDAAGRAYVSAIDFEAFADMATTILVRVDPDESVSVAADGLLFPNGSVITPDESTLIVAESWAQRLTAFDIRPDGSLTNRREWAGFAPPQAPAGPGQSAQWSCAPDGITLDAEGAIWVADAANKRAIRVREGGQILEELRAGTWTSLPAPWAATTGTP